MAGSSESLALAAHWPFVRRHLNLDRARPITSALGALAELQWQSGGEPVQLGRTRLRQYLDGSPGEAGAVYAALVELERRRAVERLRGSGRRPDAWSLRPEIARWRAMPWRTSARAVAEAVWLCRCRADFALAARIPGQRGDVAARFELSARDHLHPPGLSLVDSRGYGESRAAVARRPGKTPVDSRGYGAEEGHFAPSLSFPIERKSSPLPLSAPKTAERDRFELMKTVVGPPVLGAVEKQLWELAQRPYSDMQITAAGAALNQKRMRDGGRPGVPLRAAMLAELLESPAVRALETM